MQKPKHAAECNVAQTWSQKKLAVELFIHNELLKDQVILECFETVEQKGHVQSLLSHKW